MFSQMNGYANLQMHVFGSGSDHWTMLSCMTSRALNQTIRCATCREIKTDVVKSNRAVFQFTLGGLGINRGLFMFLA